VRHSHITALACDAIADGNTLFQAAVQSFRAGFANVGVTAAAVRGMARRDANGNFYLDATLQEDLINGRSEPDGTWTLRPPVTDGLLYVLGSAATHDVAVTYGLRLHRGAPPRPSGQPRAAAAPLYHAPAPETLSWLYVPLIATALGIPYPHHIVQHVDDRLEAGHRAVLAETPTLHADVGYFVAGT
jgi:hypothetical protein